MLLTDSNVLKGQHNPLSSALVVALSSSWTGGRGKPGRSHPGTSSRRRGNLAPTLPLVAGWEGLRSSVPCHDAWILDQDWQFIQRSDLGASVLPFPVLEACRQEGLCPSWALAAAPITASVGRVKCWSPLPSVCVSGGGTRLVWGGGTAISPAPRWLG